MKTLFYRINLLVFLSSLAALLAACKLTAAKASDSAGREQEAKEANNKKKSNTGENIMSIRARTMSRNVTTTEVFIDGS
jgi:hypothetical protein